MKDNEPLALRMSGFIERARIMRRINSKMKGQLSTKRAQKPKSRKVKK